MATSFRTYVAYIEYLICNMGHEKFSYMHIRLSSVILRDTHFIRFALSHVKERYSILTHD